MSATVPTPRDAFASNSQASATAQAFRKTARKRTSVLLILASTSPRRRELLAQQGLSFHVEASGVEEHANGWPPRELCIRNAEWKASDVAERFPDAVVIGADTIVALDDAVYGKPSDLTDARRMLESLCGRVHEVLTGVCILHHSTGKKCLFAESTRVKFRPLADVDLDAYLRDIHTLDKAGAYAAQEDEGRLIEQMEGSMSNVVGLPMERLIAALREHFPDVAVESENL